MRSLGRPGNGSGKDSEAGACGFRPGARRVRRARRLFNSPCRRRPASPARARASSASRHHRLGGDQEARDGRRVLKRGAHHLGRVDDALLVGRRIRRSGRRSHGRSRRIEQLADHDRAVVAGVVDDLTGRRLDRLADDIDAGLLVGVVDLDAVERLGARNSGDAAARQNALLDRRPRGVQRVVDAILLLLDLDLGRAADADHRDAAGELGEPLLQLLAVVVRRRLLDLGLDLADAAVDVGLLAGALDDGGRLLLDPDPLRPPEHREA